MMDLNVRRVFPARWDFGLPFRHRILRRLATLSKLVHKILHRSPNVYKIHVRLFGCETLPKHDTFLVAEMWLSPLTNRRSNTYQFWLPFSLPMQSRTVCVPGKKKLKVWLNFITSRGSCFGSIGLAMIS